jgi:O-antigen/teichoic acid export membrane protein
VRQAADQFNSVSLTAAVSLKVQEARVRLQQLLVEATRAITCVFLPCIAVFAAWGDQFLTLWVGAQFLPSYSTLVVLTMGVLAIAIQGPASQILLALERHRLMAVLAGAEAVFNLGLSILLGRRYGIVGVALGTTIPTTVVGFGVLLPYTCRRAGVPYVSLLRRLLPPFAIAASAYLAMSTGQSALGTFPNLATLAAASIVVVVVVLSASLLADRQGRRTYLPMLRALSMRRADGT